MKLSVPFVIKIFVLSNFEWPFYTGFTVSCYLVCDLDRIVYNSLKPTIYETWVKTKMAKSFKDPLLYHLNHMNFPICIGRTGLFQI